MNSVADPRCSLRQRDPVLFEELVEMWAQVFERELGRATRDDAAVSDSECFADGRRIDPSAPIQPLRGTAPSGEPSRSSGS